MPLREQVLVCRGLQLGLAIDEYPAEYGRGGFLIRAVTRGPRDRRRAGRRRRRGRRNRPVSGAGRGDRCVRVSSGNRIGALLFTCNGRGTRMFDVPNHDAVIVSDLLGGVPVTGFFAAGELGPVGGKKTPTRLYRGHGAVRR